MTSGLSFVAHRFRALDKPNAGYRLTVLEIIIHFMDKKTFEALDGIMNHLNTGELSTLIGREAEKSQLLANFLQVNHWMMKQKKEAIVIENSILVQDHRATKHLPSNDIYGR